MEEEIYRKMNQFLVHSYLYYKLDESIIPDHLYDFNCKKLVEYMEAYPDIAQGLPYYKLCQGIEDNGSGYYINDYPPQIVTTALRMLWMVRKQNPEFIEPFDIFISRWGRSLQTV